LDIQVMRPRQIFPRMLEHQEFQVSELSLSGYMTAVAKGDDRFVGVPVALSKIFRHSCIYVRTDAGVRTPQDLKGKRVGSINYTSTGVIFMRGFLQHDYGVLPEDMEWSHGPLEELESRFEAGELDVLMSLYIPTLFEQASPRIARLFPDYKQVEQDYYRRTGIFPIMHTVVVRADVCREHPWVASSIYRAFCEARDVAVDGMYDTDALRLALPWLIEHVEEARRVLGRDFWAYGLEPNRATFEALAQYLVEQGF